MALQALRVVHVVRQHHHAARRIHDVVVELAAQPFPQLERVLVDRGAFLVEIVRADDRRVAPGIAAADPALFEHGDVPHAVLFCQVIGGGEAVAAAADDDGVVGRLGFRRAPLPRPVGVARKRVAREGEKREFHCAEASPISPGLQARTHSCRRRPNIFDGHLRRFGHLRRIMGTIASRPGSSHCRQKCAKFWVGRALCQPHYIIIVIPSVVCAKRRRSRGTSAG